MNSVLNLSDVDFAWRVLNKDGNRLTIVTDAPEQFFVGQEVKGLPYNNPDIPYGVSHIDHDTGQVLLTSHFMSYIMDKFNKENTV